MPLILVLHLNRFEYAISARKKQNFVDFPVEGLSLWAHILSDKPSASYSLCAVSNHFGNLSGGHYTSYCRPSRGNVWYNCDDRSVSRLKTPVKTFAAYLFFYNSLQNVWVLLLVSVVLLFCGVRLGMGGGLMPGLWWGRRMAVVRQTNVGCRVLWSFPYTSHTTSVPVFSIPIGPIVSLLYFPCPFVPLISHNNNTHAPADWCWELLLYVTPSGW